MSADAPAYDAPRPGRPVQPEARFRSVAQRLRKRLARDEWPALAVFPSFQQIAREEGVGRETARAAVALLRGEGWLRLNARGRLVRASDLSFARRDRGLVLLLFSEPLQRSLFNPDREALYCGLAEGLGEAERPFLVAHDFYLREALPDRYLAYPLDGILATGTFLPSVLEGLARLSVPALAVDMPPLATGLPALSVDNHAAARDACERLIALGHRRIGLLKSVSATLGAADPDSLEREAGFLAALRKHRLKSRHCPIINTISRDTPRHPRLRQILSGPSRITAALCVDTGRARLLARCARSLGLAIPKDLSLVAFSGRNERGLAFSGPKIDFRALGRAAATALFKRPLASHRILTDWHSGVTLAECKSMKG
ncbi:MAG: substrate-binding domain-containing protein [Planctomycetota bacterium]|nr:substrate-binding domain-containing protein [Planctomycetota bacterium]